MRRNWFIIAATFFLVLLSPILLRRNTILIASKGEKPVLATRSMIPAVNDGSVDVYVGNEEVVSLWEDFCDGPLFIYPFAGNRRFLCDYNHDIAILVFVVDLDASGTNVQDSPEWPSNGELRSYLERNATNVVLETKGTIRLPTYAELQEVCGYVSSATASQIKAASLPYSDFGIYRVYSSKEYLLLDLATNRDSYWPMPGGAR